MGRVYAVASGKGGVGKTTTVANLGAALAAGEGDAVVVDADLGMGNLAGVLGVDPGAGATLHDVLAGTATVDEARRPGPAGLSVLPGSADLDAFGGADPANLPSVIEELDDRWVLIDTSAGLSHDSVEPLAVADEVLLVSTPERGAIEDTSKTREIAGRVGTPVAGVVVTRVTPETDVPAVGDRLGVPVRAGVPEDAAVSTAAEAGDPLVVAAPDAPATRAYRRLAADLADDPSLAPADDAASADGEDGTEANDGGGERSGFLRWLLR
jgi:septum site-determining protein MinD